MHDHAYLHALRLIPGIGSATLKTLVSHFGSAEAAWSGSRKELNECRNIGPKTLGDMEQTRGMIDVTHEWQKIIDLDITTLAWPDTRYPKLLKEIPDAPYLLYLRGDYDFSIEKPLLSVVGSRKFTDYGKLAVERLVGDLTRAGVVIVSGLAFGIDSLAHEAALENGGETLGVLGGGVDDTSIAPQSHLALGQRILGSGALLSDYLPGTRPSAGTFPARNRIIAGLSLGTLVVEAALDSGSLITARLALDYNREVFAVPGSIFSPASGGTNRLLRAGSKIVTCLDDILAELPRLSQQTADNLEEDGPALISLTPVEAKILKALAYESLHIDKLIIATTLEAALVTSALSILEIRGLVKNIGGMHYMRTN